MVQPWQSRILLFSPLVCVPLLSPSPAPPYVSVSMGVTAAAGETHLRDIISFKPVLYS